MFLCDRAKATALEGDTNRGERWQEFLLKEKQFTRPDKPILFR
jgi:hypothetical protein